jgi:universal stress protein E
MKRLLTATDLSTRADRALARAYRLAAQHGAELRVLHVVDDALPEHLAETQRLAAEEILKQRVEALSAKGGLPVSSEVVVGKPAVEIVQEAVASAAELIVVGAHRGGPESEFRGSTAEQLIRAGHHPVLVVRRDADADYGRAVIGVDFSVHSLWAARTGFRLAPQADFHLVHSYIAPVSVFFAGKVRRQARELHEFQMNEAVNEELAAFLARLGDHLPAHSRFVIEGMPTRVLLGHADRVSADLLVIGTHGRTGVGHALLGSVAEEVLQQASCDVLVAKAW